ncbi:MAG: SDR family NAD(P)-dependent oxidoreductase [Chloroflexota bacterium]
MSEKPVAFITGASSGIGYHTAVAFAQHGYRVAGTARDVSRLADVAAQVNKTSEFLELTADVRNDEMVRGAVEKTVAQFGRIDVLVANAGVGQRGDVIDAEWDHIETLLRTNIDGVLHSVRAVVPHMRRQQAGHIVTVSSVTYNMILPGAATYAASKAFVSSLARSLRMELAAHNIHITDMIVGRTATNFDANRLGGRRTGEGTVSTMLPEKVAMTIVNAVEKRRRTVILRPIDRLIVLMNILAPQLIANIARKDYKQE